MVQPPEPPSVDEGTHTHGSAWCDDSPTSRLRLAPQPMAAPPQASVEPSSGTVLRARFVLQDVIGRGGTSVIYRARDLHRALPQETSASTVAIKVLRAEQRDDPLVLTLLQREFQQMQCLSHPGIARVFDLDCDGDVWFMSMELVAGRTVKAWVQSYDSHDDALRIITRCGEALEHAHSLGIVHGDLKPTNVMVTRDGSAKLIDFGSAPSPGTVLAAGSRPILGITPLYASPQVLAGETAESRDDVYSLACLAYYILSSGRHPFGGHPSLEDGRAKRAPDHVRTIPLHLFAVIERGLSVERDRRQASVRDFLHELGDASRLRSPSARAPASSGPLPLSPALPASQAVAKFADRLRGWRPAWLPAPLVRFAVLGGAMIGLVAMVRPVADPGAHASAAETLQVAATSTAPVLVPASVVAPVTVQAAPLPAPEFTPGKRRVAPAAAAISFVEPTLRASALQSLVAVPVRRPNANGAAEFVWRVESGSAQPGIDYPSSQPQVVRFHDGQSVRTLFIPLIQPPAAATSHGPRTFTVALERVAGGPAVGEIARVTVAIDPLIPPAVARPAIYQAANEVQPKVADCRQRAPLRLTCLFSWRPRLTAARSTSD
jgi:tRNA A-37 threonylcarbamoyl transferase component Bud32